MARGVKARPRGQISRIIIHYTTRERFLNIFSKFLAEKDLSFVYGQFETAKDETYG